MCATLKLRYDGKWDFMSGETRQWTLMSHWHDRDGADRFRGSFTLEGLRELGVVKGF